MKRDLKEALMIGVLILATVIQAALILQMYLSR